MEHYPTDKQGHPLEQHDRLVRAIIDAHRQLAAKQPDHELLQIIGDVGPEGFAYGERFLERFGDPSLRSLERYNSALVQARIESRPQDIVMATMRLYLRLQQLRPHNELLQYLKDVTIDPPTFTYARQQEFFDRFGENSMKAFESYYLALHREISYRPQPAPEDMVE